MTEANRPECGRIARTTGKPCKRYAGQGTNHVGEGACNLHGAGTKDTPGGGQPGNKNALVTGEYETIYLSALSEAERQLYMNMTLHPKEVAENNLRLICIRIHRILLRIRDLELTDDGSGFATSSINHQHGWNIKGKVDITTIEKTSTLTSVMALEESLTRLQAVKIRAIEQLRAAMKDGGGGEDRLQSLVAAIDRSAANLAASRSNS